MYEEIQKKLHAYGSRERAQAAQRFFKTGLGEYGYGDVFIGVRVPEVRSLLRLYRHVDWSIWTTFVQSKIHEERLLGLLGWVYHFEKGDDAMKARIVKKYVQLLKYINNWDLVDTSAPFILGAYWLTHDRALWFRLLQSERLFDRRIAMVATLAFIRSGEYRPTFDAVKNLIHDDEDLIHKAMGWMLREVGKRDEKALNDFLEKYCRKLPRTTLRYAIERLSVERRRYFLTCYRC